MRKKTLLPLACFAFAALTAVGQEPYPGTPGAPAIIKRVEYFFDTDPGFGNGTVLTVPANADIANFTATINFNGSALTNGIHYLYIRAQDANGKWSFSNGGVFDNFLVPLYPTAGGTPLLSAVECFIDNDPGNGNGTPVTLPATNDAKAVNVLVNISGLAPGAHNIFLRTRDQTGKWSTTNYAVFDNSAQAPYPSAPAAAAPLSQVEYYLDTDPGFGKGMPISITSSTNVADFSFSVPLNGVAPGRHTVYLRSKENPWSLSAYADFLLGSTLPVQWLYVKAEAKGSDAFLSWATAREQNNAQFIVEYSSDGVRFSAVGEVAASNASSGSSYQFRHTSPPNGTAYYRVKQIDKDGQFVYSKIMMLLFRNGMKDPVLFPNPALEVVYVALPAGAEAGAVKVYDGGSSLLKSIQYSQTNQGIITIQLSGLTKGIYYVVVESSGQRKTIPLVKQ